jgi:hypothetical protein
MAVRVVFDLFGKMLLRVDDAVNSFRSEIISDLEKMILLYDQGIVS